MLLVPALLRLRAGSGVVKMFGTSAGLTFPQRKALGGIIERSTQHATAKQLGVRSDVLWRLEERGLVTRSLHEEWYVTRAGQEAYDASKAKMRGRQ